MTNEEWKRRCAYRIHRAVMKLGRVAIRDLKRATHYNRGPKDESIPLWYEALDALEKTKRVVVERDADELETFVSNPQIAALMRSLPSVVITDTCKQ